MEDTRKQSFTSEMISKSSTSKKSSVKSKKSLLTKTSTSSEEKQSELSPDEEKALIVSSIIHSLVDSALDTIYEKYLKKQAVFFVSHCSRLAWKALVDWNYQVKDPGGFKKLKTDMNALDKEPNISLKDSWAGKSIPFAVAEEKVSSTPETRKTTTVSTSDTSSLEYTNTPFGTQQTVSFEEIRTETVKKAREILIQNFQKKRKKSVEVSRVISQERPTVEFKKESYELPSPVLMPAKKFPPSRVDVRYTITPGVRGQVSRNPPKSKTIRLDKPKRTSGIIQM